MIYEPDDLYLVYHINLCNKLNTTPNFLVHSVLYVKKCIFYPSSVALIAFMSLQQFLMNLEEGG